MAAEDRCVRFSNRTETSGLFALGKTGSNFFTITDGSWPYLGFQTFSDAAGITTANIVHDVKQVRIGGIQTPQPPHPATEPSSLMLVGLALGGLGSARREPAG